MKKCEQTIDDLRNTFLDNIGIAYDLIKDDYMKMTPEELWENCFAMTFTRSFYIFLSYKALTATKEELSYLQKKSVFNDLTDVYYDGDYSNNHENYETVVKEYIKTQKKMEQTGDMQ